MNTFGLHWPNQELESPAFPWLWFTSRVRGPLSCDTESWGTVHILFLLRCPASSYALQQEPLAGHLTAAATHLSPLWQSSFCSVVSPPVPEWLSTCAVDLMSEQNGTRGCSRGDPYRMLTLRQRQFHVRGVCYLTCPPNCSMNLVMLPPFRWTWSCFLHFRARASHCHSWQWQWADRNPAFWPHGLCPSPLSYSIYQ